MLWYQESFYKQSLFCILSRRGGSAWPERLTHKLSSKVRFEANAKISGGRGFKSRPRHLIYILNRRKNDFFYCPTLNPQNDLQNHSRRKKTISNFHFFSKM